MCGITGWARYGTGLRTGTGYGFGSGFGSDLRSAHATIAAMTATMACRGPDDEGIWRGQHALLGHRRLAVIDLAGGRQPMSVNTPDGEVVLVYSGETYNYRELRAELRAAGHEFTTDSDTEVVLRGYLEWGTGVTSRLRGMYAFAVWDDRSHRLVLVCDRLGVKPLYYQLIDGGLLFGSEPKAILAHPAVKPRLDIDGWRQIIGSVRDTGDGIWHGMREVRPGGLLIADADGIREQTYWTLESRSHTDDLPTTIARVRELLADTVAEQIVADVPLCLLLSGGMDSSTLTALAARGWVGHDGGAGVRSFAVDFTTPAEHAFTGQASLEVIQRTVDAPFARQMARHAGTEHTEVVLDSVALADPQLRTQVIQARDLPVGHVEVDVSLLQLFTRIREQATVALSGEAADELFGGYRLFFDQATLAADTWPWVAHYQDQHAADLAMLTDEFRSALDLEHYWPDSYATVVARIGRPEGETDAEYRHRKVNYLHIADHARFLLDRKDRLSMAVGLEVRVPYCDHRLIEYVYNTPWAVKTHNGREKDLLRSAVADLLPAAVLDREKSGYPTTAHPGYVQAVQRQAAELATQRDHPVFDLIRRDWLATTAAVPVSQLDLANRFSMHRAILIAEWLDLFHPQLAF